MAQIPPEFWSGVVLQGAGMAALAIVVAFVIKPTLATFTKDRETVLSMMAQGFERMAKAIEGNSEAIKENTRELRTLASKHESRSR